MTLLLIVFSVSTAKIVSVVGECSVGAGLEFGSLLGLCLFGSDADDGRGPLDLVLGLAMMR